MLAFILALLGRREKYKSIQQAVSISLLAGTACAILACITGYMLSFNGDYNEDALTIHMWGGICTAAVSAAAYLVSIRKIPVRFLSGNRTLLMTLFLMVVLISITGHFGGTLTHGEGYISSDLLFGKLKTKSQVTDINEARIYEDLVQPILEKKCSNCHNSNKKKGELSMETYQSLLKGGKHGVVIEAGQPAKSELVKRVNLHPKDEKFMPTDGKTPLTEEERNILTWWIEKAGAGINKIVRQAAASASIKKDITAYLGLQDSNSEDQASADSTTNYFASLNVQKITEQQLAMLRKQGFVIKFLNLKPMLLDVTLPETTGGTPGIINDKLTKLLVVKDNVVWLNVSGNNVADNNLGTISQFKNLQRLRLDNNPVSDAGISNLQTLLKLESINLYNTKVTRQSITILSQMAELRHVYIWGSGIKKEDILPGRDSSLKIISGVN